MQKNFWYSFTGKIVRRSVVPNRLFAIFFQNVVFFQSGLRVAENCENLTYESHFCLVSNAKIDSGIVVLEKCSSLSCS